MHSYLLGIESGASVISTMEIGVHYTQMQVIHSMTNNSNFQFAFSMFKE